MTAYPDTAQFTGFNTPVRTEGHYPDLEVIGTLPPEVEGDFFRAVPDPAHPPRDPNDSVLSGDGMVSRFRFRGGRVDLDNRYVQTARWLAEKSAGQALFGRYRNPFTDDPSVQGVDRTLANTTPLYHAGRLLMTKEDGRGYEVDPETLETIGSYDFGGKLQSETMTAHSRVDAETGELFSYGYEADGLCSKTMAYMVVGKDGQLVSEQTFEAPYCGMVHDFAITDAHAIFPIFPTVADLERLKAGGPHWVHEQDRPAMVGIMPRHGSTSEMRWFTGDAGCSAYHIMNAFAEGDVVHMDLCISSTQAFPFIRRESGIDIPQQAIQGGLVRWTFDLSDPADRITVTPLGPPGDLPRIRDADTGKPYRDGWYLSINPQGGPPPLSGPVEMGFTCLFHRDMQTGALQMLGLEPGMGINEPVHVCCTDDDHAGWLLCVVDRQTGPHAHESEVWVLEADKIAAGPVARVKAPVQLRPQVHGCWVSRP